MQTVWTQIRLLLEARSGPISFVNPPLTLIHTIVQSVTCLTTDKCLTADPGVESLIPAQSHTFVMIDHEIISTAILLPFADSRRVFVSYKRKYMHKVLVNHLVKLDQEKKCGKVN